MSTLNHGNFDVVAEVNGSAITTVANALLGPRVPASQAFSSGGVTGALIPRVRVSSTTFPGRPAIQLTLDMTGTVLTITQVQIGNGPPVPVNGSIPLDGTIDVRDSLEIRSGSLVVDFTPIAGGEPVVTPHFNTARVLASPIVMIYLAYRVTQGVTAAVARAEVLAMLDDTARRVVRDILQTVGVVTVIPGTAPLTVQDFRTTPASVAALAGVGGPPGNRSLITRSILRTNMSGVFIDAAGFCVNNTSLLRDFIRPALTARLGLTAGGFVPTHPFRWSGSATIPTPGVPLISGAGITFLTAGVDELGRLHIIGTATAAGSGGAFSVSAAFDIVFTLSAATDGLTLTLTPTLVGPPTVLSDISIAWWVYVGGALTGGSLLASVLLAIDLFGGLFINGPLSGLIVTALGGAVPSIPVPISGPGLPRIVTSVSSVSLNQADATPRIFGTPSLPDGFRQHDLIVTMT